MLASDSHKGRSKHKGEEARRVRAEGEHSSEKSLATLHALQKNWRKDNQKTENKTAGIRERR